MRGVDSGMVINAAGKVLRAASLALHNHDQLRIMTMLHHCTPPARHCSATHPIPVHESVNSTDIQPKNSDQKNGHLPGINLLASDSST